VFTGPAVDDQGMILDRRWTCAIAWSFQTTKIFPTADQMEKVKKAGYKQGAGINPARLSDAAPNLVDRRASQISSGTSSSVPN